MASYNINKQIMSHVQEQGQIMVKTMKTVI